MPPVGKRGKGGVSTVQAQEPASACAVWHPVRVGAQASARLKPRQAQQPGAQHYWSTLEAALTGSPLLLLCLNVSDVPEDKIS